VKPLKHINIFCDFQGYVNLPGVKSTISVAMASRIYGTKPPLPMGWMSQ